jgi:hypothetical protein
MKRWSLSLLVLLGGLVGLAKSDYVIIIADLGLVKEKEKEQAQQPAGAGAQGRGMMGGAGMMGGPGMMGGGPGMMGGAGMRGGGGAGAGGRQAPGGRAGAGGQQQGGGAGRPGAGVGQPGGAGGLPGGGGQQGMGPPPGVGGGPGRGMMGGPGMGMMGAGGGQAMGMMGGMGGMGMGGMGGMGMGGMGMMGGGMGMMGGGMGGMGMMGGGMGMMGGMGMGGFGPTQPTESVPFYVMTVVETSDSLSKSQLDALDSGRPVKIKTKWGISVLQPETGVTITVIKNNKEKPIHSVFRQYLDRLNVAKKEGPTAELLLDFNTNPQAGPARFALEHNLLKEYREVLDEVAKLDPNNPKVKAFQNIEKAMAKPVTKPDDSGLWKQRLGIRDARQSEHYILLYSPGVKEAEVQSRLKALEDSYKSFFYWFAFNCDNDGNLAYIPKGAKDAPLVPEQRLVGLLTASEDEFNRDHRVFYDYTLVADGFTSRRDNLTILSRERLDKQYKALSSYAGPQMSIFDKDLLLQGKISEKARASTTTIARREYNLASTFALMLRSLEADSEIASITHESPRQLLHAIGLTRRNVVTPEWLQFGMGSFFQVGKGAPWGGAGGANFIYLLEYKERAQHRMSGRLEKPVEALKAVVTDGYFRASQNGKDETVLMKARTMAWSLTYFLAHRKLGNDQYGLICYFRELGRMPRDLEFDSDSLLNLFARAFKCLDVKGDKPDEAKLTQLAEEWNRFIDLTPLEVEEAVKDIRNKRNELKSTDKPGTKKSNDFTPVEGDSK